MVTGTIINNRTEFGVERECPNPKTLLYISFVSIPHTKTKQRNNINRNCVNILLYFYIVNIIKQFDRAIRNGEGGKL